jgi:hypothetical protein
MVLGALELRGHPALPLDAMLEGDAGQVAIKIVAPAVIDAGDVVRFASSLEAEQ